MNPPKATQSRKRAKSGVTKVWGHIYADGVISLGSITGTRWGKKLQPFALIPWAEYRRMEKENGYLCAMITVAIHSLKSKPKRKTKEGKSK